MIFFFKILYKLAVSYSASHSEIRHCSNLKMFCYFFFFNFYNQNLSAIFLWPILKRAVISSLPVITPLRILGAWELKFYVTTHIILRSDRSVWRQTAQRSPLCQFPVSRGTCILVHLKINFWVCLPCLKKRTRNVFVRLADTHDVYQTNRLLNIEVV